jgi:hypothetical protein
VKRGGYRIGNKLKQKLLDIDRAVIIAHDTASFSNELNEADKKQIEKNCAKIRKIIKELINEE